MTTRLEGVRKASERNEKITIRTSRATKARWSMRNSPSPRPPRIFCRTGVERFSSTALGVRVSVSIVASVVAGAPVGEGHDLLARGGARVALRHELASRHHEDPVAGMQDLLDLGGREEDAAPLVDDRG